jgi:hypothetical protein
MPITLATLETKIGGLWFKASPRWVRVRHDLKTKLKTKILKVWPKWYGTFSIKHKALSLIPSSEKKKLQISEHKVSISQDEEVLETWYIACTFH